MGRTMDCDTDPFVRCISQPEPALPLARAALLFARGEYPELAVDEYLARLDTMAAVVRARLPTAADSRTTLQALNHHLFEELGFSGNMADYYDPGNSYLNEVLDRRRGIPISLSVIYLEVAWRLEVPLEGVGFPGHFLVRLDLADGIAVLDPFNGGISLGIDELHERLRLIQTDPEESDLAELLAGTGKRDILARLLRNLKAIYLQRAAWLQALEISNRLLLVVPDSGLDLRDRGLVLEQLDCPHAALADYRRYLRMAPTAADRRPIARRVAGLSRDLPRLN